MIVDCHTHLNYYKDESQPALPRLLTELQHEMKKNRVDFSLVLSSYKTTPGRPSTRQIVDATRSLKNIYVVAGISYLSFDSVDLGELQSYLEEKTVRGIKFYCGYEPFYPFDAKMLPVIELAKKFDVPLMVHAGDTLSPSAKVKFAHPIHIDELAVDHPTLKIIVCHLGSPWFRDCMEIVYKNANVYTDISGLVLGIFNDRFERYMRSQLQEMLTYGVEAEKVLYGSDWPIASMKAYLQFINDLNIPDTDKDKIKSENAIKLFKLDPKDSDLKPSASFFNLFK